MPKWTPWLVLAGASLGHAHASAPPPTPRPSDDWGDMGTSAPADPWVDMSDLPVPDPPAPEPSHLSLLGFLRQRVGAWLEPDAGRFLSTARTSLDASLEYRDAPWRLVLGGHADYDPAYSAWAGEDSPAASDVYQSSLSLRRTYVELALPRNDAALGWQTVSWGQGNILSPLDIVTPKDRREPGLTELDDLRVPVLSTRLGLTLGAHRLEAVFVHEAAFNRMSPPRGRYSPVAPLLPPDLGPRSLGHEIVGKDLAYAHTPERYSLAAQQAFLRWSWAGSGLDLALHLASALDLQGVPRRLDVADTSRDRIIIPLHHDRYALVGTSGVVTLRSVIFKWEAAYVHDRPLARLYHDAAGVATMALTHARVLDLMVGVTLDPSPDTQLAIELLDSTFLAAPAGEYLFHPELPQLAVRLTQRALDQDLTSEIVFLAQADQDALVAGLLRVGVDYRFIDGLSAGLGLVLFLPGDRRTGWLSGLDAAGQAYARLRWDFSLR